MLEPTRDVKDYAWWHQISQQSHYHPGTNRCLAEITIQTVDRANSGYEAWGIDLYDGQTKEMLAMTRHQISAGAFPKEQDTGHLVSLSEVPSQYEDNFHGASEYIRHSMQSEHSVH